MCRWQAHLCTLIWLLLGSNAAAPASTGGFTARNLARGYIGLAFVSLNYRRNQWSKFFLQLLASRRILKFNALAFTTNQASFPKNLEMLRQRGLGNFHVAIGQKGGAVHGAVSLGQFCADANPDGVG